MDKSKNIEVKRTTIKSEAELALHIIPIYKEKGIIQIKDIDFTDKLMIKELLKYDEFIHHESTNDNTDSKFNYDIIISNIKCDQLLIENINFNSITIDNGVILDSLHINNCTINDIIISEVNRFSSLCFSSNKINNNFILHNISSEIKCEIDIENTVIDGFCKFETIKLSDIDSKINIYGDSGLIKKDLNFYFLIIGGIIDIRTIVEKNLNIYRINSFGVDINSTIRNNLKIGDLKIHASTIKGEMCFFQTNLNSIEIINSTFISNIREEEFEYNNINYTAAIILKNKAIYNNDITLEEKHRAESFDRLLVDESVRAYKNLTFKSKKNKTKKKRKLHSVFIMFILLVSSLFSENRLLLWLNKYSNDFNRSWTRGVWFTFSVSMCFYFIINYWGMKEPYFIIDWRFRDFNEVILGYLSIVDIFNFSEYNIDFNLTAIGRWIIFFSKILIAYGMYQTIYAFYKYKK